MSLLKDLYSLVEERYANEGPEPFVIYSGILAINLPDLINAEQMTLIAEWREIMGIRVGSEEFKKTAVSKEFESLFNQALGQLDQKQNDTLPTSSS